MADINTPFLTFVQQTDGAPRFAYGSDERRKRLLYRRDDASGNWIVQQDASYGHSFRPFKFNADDSLYYAMYSATGEPTKLVRQEMKSAARVTLAENSIGNINVFQYDKLGIPFAAGTSIGIPHVNYFDPQQPDAVLHKQLSAQFPDSIVHFINYTDDGLKLLFSVASDRDPGSYFLYDKTSNKADLLFSTMPEIFPEDMAAPRSFQRARRPGFAWLPDVAKTRGEPEIADDFDAARRTAWRCRHLVLR